MQDAGVVLAGLGSVRTPWLAVAQPGWLEVVLSWPQRIIRPAADPDVRRTATG